MANSLLTLNMITREALRLWKNEYSLLAHVDTQYDDSYTRSGAKIGTALRIRLPNDYTVRTGPAASPQDTQEQSITLTVSTQKGVDVSFSEVERTMTLDDYSKRVLAPMVNVLIGSVATDVMSGAEGGSSNFTANVDSANNIITPRADDWLNAGAILDLNSAPRTNRKIIADPLTMARTVSSLAGLFNPSGAIGTQYDTAMVKNALGFDWYIDQTVIKHTTGTAPATTGAPTTSMTTVSGANQSGLSVTVAALTGTLAVGDVVFISSVNAVNRITKASTQTPRQFVITAAAAAGATSISIYPAIVGPTYVPGTGYVQSQYQTVDSLPANGANIYSAVNGSAVYRKNLAFVPEAIAMATADMEIPRGVHEAEREEYEGISLRMITAYNIMTDQMITRMDVLYGWIWLRPEWVVVIGDAI